MKYLELLVLDAASLETQLDDHMYINALNVLDGYSFQAVNGDFGLIIVGNN